MSLFTTKNGVLGWLEDKENRIRFFRKMFKQWHKDSIPDIDSWKNSRYEVFKDNPQYYANITKIFKALEQSGYTGGILYKEVFKVYDAYWERINKFVYSRDIKPAKLSYTEALKELLRRGFVLTIDCPHIIGKWKKYPYIRSVGHGIDVSWPTPIEEEGLGAEIQRKYGLRYFTFLYTPSENERDQYDKQNSI